MAYVKSIREGKDVDDISEKNGVPARNLFDGLEKTNNGGKAEMKDLTPSANDAALVPLFQRKLKPILTIGSWVSSLKELLLEGRTSSEKPAKYRNYYRVSQSVSKVRNYVTEIEVATFVGSLAKVIVEENMDATRVFNVDETAFESSRKTTRVVALKGAGGFIVAPLFILPGERVEMKFLSNAVYLELQ
ncbi:hypothetical protein DVH05_005342 [Phytophthora capsici]|nr:hypothetical protein DVH05_006713 [Phytophthora capsici]KAG1687176.1 hypothetical protein DVH05_005342 [Phytophthora capsici]